ncbi:uncharacterized protein SAPINGB_P004225 [Magnusiomyces paraingens]|uniref:Mitochondrial adapter protein MCP1 transmembrane domain-containing protein n=1 Tax=Magnusiomyces paraingens TaxID=2606893 RepID=A0A5E8C0V4_9ASCO|nr:uncharacterized protein SAPINGB_P004225 [Saprochaete ingens]VVT54735.1 unnamed protein product [Saprochaete ingens]
MPHHHHRKSSSLDRLAGIPLNSISPEEAHAAALNQLEPQSTANAATNTTEGSPPEPTPSAATPSESGGSSPFPSTNTLLRVLFGIQRYSAYTFTGFLGLHLTSVVLAPAFSYDAGNASLLFTNTIYQSPLVEPILVTGSLALHITSGIVLRIIKVLRSKRLYESYWTAISKPTLLAYAGYAATPLVLGHFYVTRYLPLSILGDSSLISLDYVAHSIADHPAMAIGSMLTMLTLTLYHTVYGWRRWLNIYKRPKLLSGPGLFVVSGILLGVASLARLAAHGPAIGWVASQYDKVLGKV